MRPLSLLFALLGALLALPSWAGPSELERKLEQQIAAFQAGSLSGEDLRRELIAEGSEVFPLVLEAAPSARGPVRGVLLRALLQLDRKRGEAALLELTRDRFLYAAALDALAEEGGPDLLEPLLELLDVESPARSKARLALIALARRTRTERRLVEALELRVRKAVELKAWSVGFNEALGLLLELERYRCVKVVRDCLQERPLRPAALNGLARLVPEDGELEGEGWENWRQLCAALEALLARPVELSGLEQCQVLNALRSVGTLSQLPALIRYGASDPSQSCRDLLEDALEDLSGLEQPTLDHWRAYWTKVEPIWERYPELLDQVSNQGEEQALAALGQLRYVRNRRTMAAIELRLSEPVGERLLLGFVELLVELALPRTNDLLDAIARNSGATPAVLKQVEWARGFFRDAPDPPPGERRMRALPRRRAQARSRPPQQILIAGEGLADSDARAGVFEPPPAPSPKAQATPAPGPPPGESLLRLPRGREWFLVLVGVAGLLVVVLALIPAKDSKKVGLLTRPEEREDSQQARLEAYLEQKMLEGNRNVALHGDEEEEEEILADFEAGLSLLAGEELAGVEDAPASGVLVQPASGFQSSASKAIQAAASAQTVAVSFTGAPLPATPPAPAPEPEPPAAEPAPAPTPAPVEVAAQAQTVVAAAGSPPEAPGAPPASLEGGPLEDAALEAQWQRMLSRLQRLEGSVSWIGTRLSSQPDRLQAVFDSDDWVPFPNALEELNAIRPMVDEVQAVLAPLVLSEKRLEADQPDLLSMSIVPDLEDDEEGASPAPPPAATPRKRLDGRRWEELRAGLTGLGGDLERLWVVLEGTKQPLQLFQAGGSLAALSAQLDGLRERIQSIRVAVSGFPGELVFFDALADHQRAPSAASGVPWLVGRDPSPAQWTNMLQSLGGLAQQIVRVEVLTLLARATPQVLFARDPAGATWAQALAGLVKLRPLLEQVRLTLPSEELIAFQRDQDAAVMTLMPGDLEDFEADEEPRPEAAPADEGERWLAALRSAAQLQGVLRELWVSPQPGDEPQPWVRQKGLTPALEELRAGAPCARLAAELVNARTPVVLYERGADASAERGALPEGAHTAAWERLPAALADLSPALAKLVILRPGGESSTLMADPELGAQGLWQALQHLGHAQVVRIEAHLHGLPGQVVYEAPIPAEGGLRQRLAELRPRELVAELHVPAGHRIPLAADDLELALTQLSDLYPVLARVLADGKNVYEQAPSESLQAPREPVRPAPSSAALSAPAPRDPQQDPDWQRVSAALANAGRTAEAILARIGGEERRLAPAAASAALLASWSEVERVALQLPGVKTPMVLLERQAPSLLDRRWSQLFASLEGLGDQLTDLVAELEGGAPRARWTRTGDLPLRHYLTGLQANRARVSRVLARLDSSPNDLLLYSGQEPGSRRRAAPGQRSSRNLVTSRGSSRQSLSSRQALSGRSLPSQRSARDMDVGWKELQGAIQRMRPLLDRFEVCLSDRSDTYEAVYVEGGDFAAALERLNGMRPRLESVRLVFQPMTLFQRFQV